MSDFRRVAPGPRSGALSIPASKSVAHRLLICAAFSAAPVRLLCHGISRDIRATADCLNAMGAAVSMEDEALTIFPLKTKDPGADWTALPCGESGSTLRFLLPVVGALGLRAVFHMEGRLPERPMDPLTEELSAHGQVLRKEGSLLYSEGRLCPGAYAIPGHISSQYVSGLLFALPLLAGESTLEVTGRVESADYIAMTESALTRSGFQIGKSGYTYRVPGAQRGRLPGEMPVESDWSSAAFFLCLGALSPAGIRVSGLNLASSQGDRAVLEILKGFGASVESAPEAVTVRARPLQGFEIDASGIPDLVPVLSVVAAGARGDTRFTHAERLRLKESDRIQTTLSLLKSLGARAEETPDGLIVHGAGGEAPGPCLSGGSVQAYNDHRIAMSAAVAAALCENPVEVSDPRCTEKSFPRFWETLEALKLIP